MSSPSLNTSLFVRKKISYVEKYNFYEYLSVMLDSGVGMSQALESVSEKIQNPYFHGKISELVVFIESGDTFSKAMKKMPQVFTPSEISLIESGEQTGKLASSFEKLSEDLKQIHNLKQKIQSALSYPCIIFGFLLIAMGVVLIYVIPNISPLFVDAGIELPLATKALLATSNFVIHQFFYLVFFIVSIVILFLGYRTTQTGRRNVDSFYLSLPLIGKVYRNYILADIAGNLGSLIGSGVSIVKALTLTGTATGNTIYEQLFSGVVARVSAGEKIVDAMRSEDPDAVYFPNDFLQMLAVGEQSARIDQITVKINAQYNRELEYSLVRLTKFIEPLAILIAGLFVVWFAFAVFGAILKVTTAFG